ncbi:MAG: hypothetical protein V1708_06180 [Candidatus Micrarchaeota archaeon]
MKQALAAVLAFALISVLASHAYYGSPLHRDLLASWRAAELLGENGLPLAGLNSGEASSRYPPAFSIFLVQASLLCGIGLPLATDLLAYVCAALLVLSAFVFARNCLGDENAAAVAAFLCACSPWFFYRMAYPIAESLGLSLFLLSVAAVSQRRQALATFILLALPFVHFRSAAVAFACVLALSALRRDWKLAMPALPGMLAYAVAAPLAATGFSNPWIEPVAPLLIIGIPLAVLSACFAGEFILRRQELPLPVAAVLLACIATAFLAPFPERQLLYAAPALAVLAAAFLLRHSKLVVPAMPVATAFLLLAVWYRSPAWGPADSAGFFALENFGGATVLASLPDSYAVTWFSKKSTVAGPYLEELADGRQRAQQSFDYFNGGNTSAGEALVRQYRPDLIIRRKDLVPGASFGARVFDGPSFSAFRP